MDDDTSTRPSLGQIYQQVQQALEAVGAVEMAVGDFGSSGLQHETRDDLNAAVLALQAVRGKLAGRIESQG